MMSNPQKPRDDEEKAARSDVNEAGSQASRGRSEYGQVGGTRETAEDSGGYSRDGRQGGFGEEKPEAKAAKKSEKSSASPGRPGGQDASHIPKKTQP